MVKRLVASVGLNLKGDHRYEQGQAISESHLDKKSRSYLIAEGYAIEIDAPPATKTKGTPGQPLEHTPAGGERLPTETAEVVPVTSRVVAEAVGSLKPKKKGKGK